MPTLNVFLSEEIKNVCCVVTRYFGGTLLGTGGLARAYSKAAKLALEEAGVAQMAQWRSFSVGCDYGFFERAKRILEDFEAVTKETDFGTEVALKVLVREDKAEVFTERLTDLSNGKAVFEDTGSQFLSVRIR